MRSFEEIDRDMAGMHDNCQRQSHGCSFPSCNCLADRMSAALISPVARPVAQPLIDSGASGSPARPGRGQMNKKDSHD